MSVQRFFGGKFNGDDMAQTQQRSRMSLADAVPVLIEHRAAIEEGREPVSTRIGNPALVLRIDRGFDVVAFGPYRRLNDAPLTRAQAEALCR